MLIESKTVPISDIAGQLNSRVELQWARLRIIRDRLEVEDVRTGFLYVMFKHATGAHTDGKDHWEAGLGTDRRAYVTVDYRTQVLTFEVRGAQLGVAPTATPTPKQNRKALLLL